MIAALTGRTVTCTAFTSCELLTGSRAVKVTPSSPVNPPAARSVATRLASIVTLRRAGLAWAVQASRLAPPDST